MYFNPDGAIFSLNDKRLKLIDPFIYFGSNISSTKIDVSICVVLWDRYLPIHGLFQILN